MTEYRTLLSRYALPITGTGDGLFVMLNPSTADEHVDDPTIRRCIGFAKSFGWRKFDVVNLFAGRATDPRDLAAMDDPIGLGVGNNEVIDAALVARARPVAAWGALPKRMAWRVAEIMTRHPSTTWSCLGTTSDGSPRHPLFVKADARLVDWDAKAWLHARPWS